MTVTTEHAKVLKRGPFADRPLASVGRYWFLSDEGGLYKSDGSAWTTVIAPGGGGAVSSVFTRTGAVTAASGDYTASQVTNVAAGAIAATDVQAALNELDTEKQPVDSDLTAIAALVPTNDDVVQRKAGAWTNRSLAQLIADLAALGTTFQPLDSELSALAGLVSAPDKLPYFTGSGTAALATLSTFIRTLLDDADAATARATLGVIASLFQAGGAQAIKLDDLATPDDNTDLDVSTAQHGLVPKAPGGTAKFLREDATWADPSLTGGTVIAARVYNSGAQSINASTDTALTFDTENFDTDAIHSTVSATSKLTCKTAGKYVIQAQVEWDASATGVRIAQIRLNGTTVIASNRKLSLSTGVTQMLVETLYDLAVNDYVEVVVNQTSLAALNVDGGSGTTWFGMVAQAPQGPAGSNASVASDTIWDAKGDLAGGTGADTAAKLTVGADYSGLVADSSQTTGLRWVPGASVLLYDYTVAGSDKASIDTGVDTPDAGIAGTSAFPAGRLLEIQILARTDEAVTSSTINLTFNNDTGANYDLQRVTGANATASAGNALAQTALQLAVDAASSAANFFTSCIFTFPAYAATVAYKRGGGFFCKGDSTATNDAISVLSLTYRSTAAITRVAIAPNTALKKFKVGTRLLIYAR